MHPLERRYAWHLPGRLDLEAMRAGARLLEGEHDFAAFQAQGSDVTTTVRCISSSRIAAGDTGSIATHGVHRDPFSVAPVDHDPAGVHGGPPLVCYEVTGSGFLRHMVRAIVGSLVEVGRGRQSADWIARALASHDRSAAGPTAPAHGLFLVRVSYGGPPIDGSR